MDILSRLAQRKQPLEFSPNFGVFDQFRLCRFFESGVFFAFYSSWETETSISHRMHKRHIPSLSFMGIGNDLAGGLTFEILST